MSHKKSCSTCRFWIVDNEAIRDLACFNGRCCFYVVNEPTRARHTCKHWVALKPDVSKFEKSNNGTEEEDQLKSSAYCPFQEDSMHCNEACALFDKSNNWCVFMTIAKGLM